MVLVHELPEALRAADQGVPAGQHDRPPLLQAEDLICGIRSRQDLRVARARARAGVPGLRVQLCKQRDAQDAACDAQAKRCGVSNAFAQRCTDVSRTASLLGRA